MWCVVKLLLFYVTVCVARKITDEELYRLPRLFHLDDYDRCLSQKDGVYCMGTFELTPKTTPNDAYDIAQEQLKDYFSFDRRLLHRGYCFTNNQLNEQNTTFALEERANRILRKHALTARLQKLSYCTTHSQRKTKLSQEPDLPQRLFLYVVFFILFLNVIGTLHDVYGFGKKNRHLMAWSIPANWRAITTIPDKTSLFAPVQSSKIILHCIIIYTHSYLLHFMGYMYNPEQVEKSRDTFVLVLIRNGTSLVQVFILISSFYTGCTVLEAARKTSVNAVLVTKWVLKRIFRLAPVYLLLVGYSATWWPRTADGPLWSPIVEAESQVCREKFWTHVLFLNNFVRPSELCMVQSWAMAADIQLFLLSMLLTLLLIKLKMRAVKVLGALFIASCLFNIVLAYAANLVPMVKIIVPETLRTQFRGSKSFFHLHTSPWSNLPACLFGLLIAHLHFEKKYKHKTTTFPANEMKEGNGVIVNENGVCVRDNGTNYPKDGSDVNEKEFHVKENDTYIKEDGGYAKKNDTCVNGDDVHAKENGVHVNGNCVLATGNGVHVNGNGVHVNGTGVYVNGYGVHVNRNGVYINTNGENGVHVKGNKLYLKENGIYFKGNGLHYNGNSVYTKENGANVKENDVHVKANSVHVNDNSVHDKEHGILSNGNGDINEDFMNHNGNIILKDNGIRYRNITANGTNKHSYTNIVVGHTKNNGFTNSDVYQNSTNKLNKNGIQNGITSQNKEETEKKASFWLRYAHFFTFPVLVVWIAWGSLVVDVEWAPAVALYVGLERVMFSLSFAFQLLQVITIKGPWARAFSWRGWVVPARLVLSVAMVHWSVSATIVAARPQPVTSSVFYVSIDWLATLFYSYLIALPLSVLVELPMKNALEAVIS